MKELVDIRALRQVGSQGVDAHARFPGNGALHELKIRAVAGD
jgi:hypothetical protein